MTALQSLIHFITDHMTEIKSPKALMPWNKCLGKWAAFHITARDKTVGHICADLCKNGAKYLLYYLYLYNIYFPPRG